MDGLCFDDMDEFGRELEDPLEELVQDVVHGLLETFGSNPDVLTRGAGLIAALSGSSGGLGTVTSQIDALLKTDNRISSSTVDIQPTAETGSYAINLVLVVNKDVLAVELVVDSGGGVRRTA